MAFVDDDMPVVGDDIAYLAFAAEALEQGNVNTPAELFPLPAE
jgi:hypothetical protein